MKFTLSELERARNEPTKFAARKFRSFGLRPTFSTYWAHAAKLYHRLKAEHHPNPKDAALAYFREHCQAKLSNDLHYNRKMLSLSGSLDMYIRSYTGLNYPFVQVNKRVQFTDIPGHLISGRIDRLDLNPIAGYVATSFQTTASKWQTQLRVPVAQKALANELGCKRNRLFQFRRYLALFRK